jgi:hypothetical protein
MAGPWILATACVAFLAGGEPDELTAGIDRDAQWRNVEQAFGPVRIWFESPAAPASFREWPEVTTPRKFTLEMAFDFPATQVLLHAFNLRGHSGDWWLAEVMAFLFEPEVAVEAGLTDRGDEVYYLTFPGGAGAYESTEALVLSDGAAYRFYCLRCRESGMLPLFERMVNSLESVPSGQGD